MIDIGGTLYVEDIGLLAFYDVLTRMEETGYRASVSETAHHGIVRFYKDHVLCDSTCVLVNKGPKGQIVSFNYLFGSLIPKSVKEKIF